ncbi:MAG: hypothetical protein A2173_05840 [Planctomycetes bacterium RBG_13_44_8b]|nr:MAG: hypothetical protein A2173_05840 [Planctomycetes bacterium RBG_13_44_8b]
MNSDQKIIITTKQEINGFQRKLAWFSFHKNGLYFEIAGMLDGSHTSYHSDGNLFRTSPATKNRAAPMARLFPLAQFREWHNLGLGMILKSSLNKNPELKNKDRKYQVYEVNVDQFPNNALNLIVELIEPNRLDLFNSEEMCPPQDACIIEIKTLRPWIIVTILGHEHNLLICPYDGEFQGMKLRHFNKRYSANRIGDTYSFEAYKID